MTVDLLENFVNLDSHKTTSELPRTPAYCLFKLVPFI